MVGERQFLEFAADVFGVSPDSLSPRLFVQF